MVWSLWICRSKLTSLSCLSKTTASISKVGPQKSLTRVQSLLHGKWYQMLGHEPTCSSLVPHAERTLSTTLVPRPTGYGHLWNFLQNHFKSQIMCSNHKQLTDNPSQAEAKQNIYYKLYTQLNKLPWITHCYVLVCHLLWYSKEQKSLLKNKCILFGVPFSNDVIRSVGVGHRWNIDRELCCLKYRSL